MDKKQEPDATATHLPATRTNPTPDPASSARDAQIPGRTIRSGGHRWTLAALGLARSITAARDSLHDDIAISQDVAIRDVQECAYAMILANYDLAAIEIATIIAGADRAELIAAVRHNAHIHDYADDEATYTQWARSALIANGIDPARLARDDSAHVLRQLVATGRAMPLEDFTGAAAFAQARANLLAEV